MPRKPKEKPLPPLSAVRKSIFEGRKAPDGGGRLHRQLCLSTPVEREKWAKASGVPVIGDLESWGNKILIAHFERADRYWAAFERILSLGSQMQDCMKATALGMPGPEAANKYLVG